MNNAEFQLRGVGDPRLAVHATSALPAWLWSTDGTRILWANPVGARLFGAANGAILADRNFGPADQHRRQIAQLAARLPLNGAFRLERLRGFGAALGTLVTCGCARLDFADGSHGILVAAAEPVGRAMPLVERLQRLVEGIDTPIAAFARDGLFIGASDSARSLLGFRNLTEAGLDEARSDALREGRVETPIGIGHLVLQRVGTGADVGLVALIAPGATTQASHPVAPPLPQATMLEPSPQPIPAAADQPIANHAQAAISSEAPAEFAFVDEFAEEPEAAFDTAPAEPARALQAASTEPAPEPTPDDVQSEISVEAPAEFALIDEFADEQAQTSALHVSTQHGSAQEVTHDTSLHRSEAPAEVEAAVEQPSFAAAALPASAPAPSVAQPARAPSWLDQPAPITRRQPLRFMWQMDADGRFSLGSDEFTRLIGSRTAAGFGRMWSDIATAFGIDPEGRVLKAVATHDTWSGITLNWPVDGGDRLPVDLSGLPMFDRARNFAGYRGFGVCRDLDGLARLAALRRFELFSDPPAPQALSAGNVAEDSAADLARDKAAAEIPVAESPIEDSSVEEFSAEDAEDLTAEDLSAEDLSADALTEDLFVEDLPAGALPAETSVTSSSVASSSIADPSAPMAFETSHPTDLETSVETPSEMPNPGFEDTPKNVLPFRPVGEAKSPVLTPVENSAFDELARQLSARLEGDNGAAAAPALSDTPEAALDQPAALETPEVHEQPQWLVHPEAPARGETRRDKALLDLVPVGVLIYRLDRLLYANAAFLERMGYPSLHALEEAGGLDALYVEPGVSSASSTSGTGTPVTISATQTSSATEASIEQASATQAHLYTISWDDDSALALIFAGAGTASTAIAEPIPAASIIPGPSAVGHANAEELGAILDTTAEGIVMFDAEGNLNSANRSAEALFGYDGFELVQRNLADLFAPESQSAVGDYLISLKGSGVASLLDQGREVLGQVRGGGLVPLSMTMGRTQADGPNFFAVFRDLSQTRKSESELLQARRLADRAANAKSDMLARISHEVRTPLNAIIGFAEVMIGERFGALGNERYIEYMKDIRASGERVIAIINDLLDLSRIETGMLDLAFANQNLNDLVEQCVAVMQPQANRERIIIRTSLAHLLPPVVADARALRQITLNLIGNSIHLANAGGQVIVSTALSDLGEVVLRVRDTGHGLNDNEVAAAMEPFRTPAPSDQASDSSGVSLSLTKALVEANRARFQIKTGPHSGTLIEVVFAHALVRA
jgi:PAS domain S-box-containing protein